MALSRRNHNEEICVLLACALVCFSSTSFGQALGALVCFSSTSFGQALSPADREKGVKYLEQTRDAVIAATNGLSEAQWNFKAAPDKWSAAETLEHIALAEDYLFGFVKNKVMKDPPGPADRDIPIGVPTGRWTPAETLDHFLKSRAVTIEFMKTTPDLREHVTEGPVGKLDAYEWLLFIGEYKKIIDSGDAFCLFVKAY